MTGFSPSRILGIQCVYSPRVTRTGNSKVPMIKDFETVRSQLKELSDVLNSYKSEAVQLRLVDLIFGSPVAPLAEGLDLGNVDKTPPAPKKRKRARLKNNATTDSTTPGKAPVRAARSSSRPGGKATLATLIDEGFFKQPRTIGSIVKHCQQHRASTFKQSDFSGALGRYVREKTLTRAHNADNQYEYRQP